MHRAYDGEGPEPIGFLLIPKFSMMAFFSAVEPLRVANRLSGKQLFSWHAFSADGEPVEASNGMRLMVEGPVDKAAAPTLIICAGFDPQRHETRRLLATLRRLSHAGIVLGALDTGAHVLAKAGLIGDAPVTMHWEAVPAFQEEFPQIAVSDELFEVQRRFFTCAGGTAALDMMLDMIGRKHGMALAVAVSEQFIHDRIRDRHDHQRMELSTRLRVTNSKVLKIVNLMERNLEQPIDNQGLAQRAGITARQMERLFRRHLGVSPSEFYRNLRLTRARHLLRQTDMSVLDIAMASGFSSASCLSRRYRAHFGVAPRDDREETPLRDEPVRAAS
jgi:transcriptional regulator GlxA family with amidase domain